MTTTNSIDISDEAICALGRALVSEGRYSAAMWCDYALIRNPERFDIPAGCDRATARRKCAEMLVARAA